MLAVAAGDRDAARVDQRQVALRQPEHVEVVAEPRAGVESPQHLRDPRRHPGRRQRLVRHRPRGQPLEDEDVQLRDGVDDPRRDAGLGRRERVVQLVAAIDRQQLGRRPRDPHEVGRARRPRPGSSVGQPGRDPLRRDGPAGPRRDRGDDLLDRGRHAERVAQPLPCRGRSVSAAGVSASMVEHARAVIIGGGVGGTSHRVPPDRARLARTSSSSTARS